MHYPECIFVYNMLLSITHKNYSKILFFLYVTYVLVLRVDCKFFEGRGFDINNCK